MLVVIDRQKNHDMHFRVLVKALCLYGDIRLKFDERKKEEIVWSNHHFAIQ